MPSLELARGSGGSIEGISDAEGIAEVSDLAETEGILTETAGGVTVGALREAIERGAIGADDQVVLVISGNGLKTLDAFDITFDEPIARTLSAFEQWWAARGGAA